jgi:leukotriene-A4 hydrolase
MLTTAENQVGKYAWGTYNILVLPPSFPYGGMENPLMTFASPTIITKDRSEVTVALHEIMHSWTGNTVTMRNWSDFWMNEGFTVYNERKASEVLYGKDYFMVSATAGNKSMTEDMKVFGFDSSFSSLTPDLS